MLFLHLAATNDNNGNPRRLYLVFKDDRIDAVVDEGYRGEGILRELYPDLLIGPMYRINIPVSEYNGWVRFGKDTNTLHPS